MEFTIPKPVLESINSSLMMTGRLYIKELAAILKVDSKELIKSILPSSEKIVIKLTDKPNTQCQALVRENSILKRCRLPICNNSNDFCKTHISDRLTLAEGKECTKIVKLKDSPERMSLWKTKSDVINSHGTKVGSWNNTYNRLTIFIIEKQ